MSKFKVGDRVKTEFGIGKIVEITEELGLQYLVYHDDWNNGHNGNGLNKKKHFGDHCYWFLTSELELVEPPITSEIKITCDNLQTTNLIVNRNQELYDWYEKNVKKKEGNNMIESLNLVDLYASKQKEKIENDTTKKVEELRENCEIINKFKLLVEQFQDDCKNLYLSQFTEEEKNEIVSQDFDDSNKPLIKTSLGDYNINLDFKPSEYFDLMNERNKEINKINELVKTVKAHVSIAKTKEEVEEILTRYEILKKGVLVTK